MLKTVFLFLFTMIGLNSVSQYFQNALPITEPNGASDIKVANIDGMVI